MENLPQAKTDPRRPCILVVDDEPVIRAICADVLISEGYEVQTATTGQEALVYLAHTRADLVLMDIQMPGMDGLTACRTLQATLAPPPPPVVIMSATPNIRGQAQAATCQIAGIVPKPFDLDALLGIVAHCLA